MPFTDKPNNQKGTGVLCPALIVSAPSSGAGKTTITAALARYHRNQGRKVTVFKVGPDFIDPMILRQASGELVYQLDLWLVGEQKDAQVTTLASRFYLHGSIKIASVYLKLPKMNSKST